MTADLPVTHDARLCAVRHVERQAAFMTRRGWLVQMPVVRVADAPFGYDDAFYLPSVGHEVLGVTYQDDHEGWTVLLPPAAERSLCRAETRARAGLRRQRSEAVVTVFHELAHQFFRGEVQAEWRAQRLTQHWTREAK